jgi:hypothetical protein
MTEDTKREHDAAGAPLSSEPTAADRLRDALRNEAAPYSERMRENVERVFGLVNVATKDGGAQRDDILRAAVVLSHAYLEDYLRTIAEAFLPEADEKTLDEIPLVGSDGRRPDKKYLLGRLSQHRGKLVEQVLQESVSAYLERSNFNSIEDITEILERLGFRVTELNQDFGDIAAMINRRHLIVHRADRVRDGDGNFQLQTIDAEQVMKWVGATQDFMGSLLETILERRATPEWLLRKYSLVLTIKQVDQQ